jgi:hypothetical protein
VTPDDIRKLASTYDCLWPSPTAEVLRACADVVEQGLLVEAYIGDDDETGGAFWEAMKRLEALKP